MSEGRWTPARMGEEPKRLPPRDTVETVHARSLAAGWRIYVPSQYGGPLWTFHGKLGCSIEEVRRVALDWDLDLDEKRKAIHVYGPMPPGLVAGDTRPLPSPGPMRALGPG